LFGSSPDELLARAGDVWLVEAWRWCDAADAQRTNFPMPITTKKDKMNSLSSVLQQLANPAPEADWDPETVQRDRNSDDSSDEDVMDHYETVGCVCLTIVLMSLQTLEDAKGNGVGC
jgi:hypothetical protein